MEELEGRLNPSPSITGLPATVQDTAGSSVVLAPSLSISDTDGTATILGASVTIGNYQQGEDFLNYTGSLPVGVIVTGGSFDTSTGQLDFQGSASLAAYSTLLETVTYEDVNYPQPPATTFSPRSVAFGVADSDDLPGAGSMNVTVISPQTIAFGPLSPVTYGVSPIMLGATASSGLAVSYSIDGSSTGTGIVSGNMLTVTGAGDIVIDANQAGNTDYLAAPQVQQSLVVDKKTLFISGLSASNKTYDDTTTDPLTGTASLLTAESPGGGSTSDGTPYTGDQVSLVSTSPSAFVGTLASKDAAMGIAVTVTGGTLTGGAGWRLRAGQHERRSWPNRHDHAQSVDVQRSDGADEQGV